MKPVSGLCQDDECSQAGYIFVVTPPPPPPHKGTTINDLGRGPEEIEKKNSEALLQGKINFEGHSPGKDKFCEAPCRKKNAT